MDEEDSEVTPEGTGETSPLSKAEILHAFPDDDKAGEHPMRESPNPAGVKTRSGCTPPNKPPTGVPKKSRSALIPRGGVSASSPASAAANPGAVPLSAPGARAPVPSPQSDRCSRRG